eukprot:c16027_g2_i1.p1 GENE.c16027_g2_i1~~c16027_g2_i1.p1  ORF type:complete len:210 (-),score=48.45 c16027_g2_i1:150-779(-)
MQFVVFRRLMLLGFIFQFILCFVIFIGTLDQTTNKTTTHTHPEGIFSAKTDSPNQCGTSVIRDNRPFLLHVNAEDVYCGWDNDNTFVRVCYCLFGIATASLCIFLILSSGQRKTITIANHLILFVIPLSFSCFCLDLYSFLSAFSFCTHGMPGVTFNTQEPPAFPKICQKGKFPITIALDGLVFVVWVLLLFGFYKFAKVRELVEYNVI